MYFGPFKELTPTDPAVKILNIDEMIFATIFFAGSWRARG
jgi:hypothetical protein